MSVYVERPRCPRHRVRAVLIHDPNDRTREIWRCPTKDCDMQAKAGAYGRPLEPMHDPFDQGRPTRESRGRGWYVASGVHFCTYRDDALPGCEIRQVAQRIYQVWQAGELVGTGDRFSAAKQIAERVARGSAA